MSTDKSGPGFERGARGGFISIATRYGLALLLTLSALIVHRTFSPILQLSMLFAFFTVNIALSAILGGLGPGLFATFLSVLLIQYWLIDPQGSFAISDPQALGSVASFLVIGVLFSLVVNLLRRSLRREVEQENRFRTLFERSPLGNILIDSAADRFVVVNPRFCELVGYEEKALLGMTVQSLIDPEDREKIKVDTARMLRGEITEDWPRFRLMRGDGRLIWVEALVTLMHTSAGEPLFCLANVQDITRRKQMDEALRESEARFRQVVHSAGSAIIGLDADGRITLYNGFAEQIFGYKAEEVLGRDVVGTIVPPYDAQGRDMRAVFDELFRHVDQHLYNENENLTKDGRRIWMAWTNRPILSPGGRLSEIICVGQDQTARKRTEEALRQSEERFRAAYERAPLGIAQIALDGHFLDVNETLCRMLGYSREELLGKTFVEVTHPEDRRDEDYQFKQLFRGDYLSYQIEKRYLRKDGEPIWVRVTSSMIQAPEPYRISMIEDITLRKQAEELQIERAFLRQVLDATPSMVFVKDWDGRFLLANEALAHCYGTTIQGVMNHTDADFNTNAEELERFLCDDRQVMSTRQEKVIPEEEVTFANGEVHWFSTIKVPLIEPDGTCNKVLGVASDITERKRAEEALSESEEKFRLMAESANAVVGIVQDKRFVYANPFFERLSGYSLPEILAKDFIDFVHPDFRQQVAENARNRLLGLPAPERYEFKMMTRQGEERWMDFAPERIEYRSRPAIIGIAHDVTEQKRAEVQARRWQSVFEKAEFGLAHTDAATNILIEVNEAYARQRGYTPEELIGQQVFIVYPAEEHEAIRQRLREIDTTGHVVYESVHQRKDGVCFPVLMEVTLITDDQGRPVSRVSYALDITERKQAEKELRQINERLREADRQKDEFLAMLAHELRNPLAPIRNAVQIMQLIGANDQILMRQRDIVERQVAHMARLLDDLLDVSRITRGRAELKKQPVKLVEVLARAVETASPLIDERRHDLLFTPPAAELRVDGDFDRLIQIVGNLLNNAAKYTEDGGRIWLTAEREGSEAVIRVRDTGVGLTPEMLPRIFDVFTQAERSLDRSQGGLGLGLPLVHNLVQMHGGRVEAHSAGLGKGSEFIVRLPALPSLESPGSPAKNFPVQEGTTPHRILVVDDVPDTTDSLAELLGLLGHEVRTAYDGPAALAIAGEFRPEVILLDIGLPGMDGFEVARRIRRNPALEGVLLLALTGYGQEGDRKLAQQSGFDRLLTKPVDFNALKSLLS